MWDTFRLSAVGSFSFRRIALIFMAVLMSALFMATAYSTTTFAADANWNGDTITYGNGNYSRKDLTLPGTDSGSQTYVSTAQSDICPRPATVIVVPGGANTANEIQNAQAVNYTVDCNGNYTDPKDVKTISIAAKADGGNGGDDEQKDQTSCAVQGIGWIVCSTSRFMADSMDRVYGWISDFLTVKPLSTDTNSPLYQTWAIVRGLANACFIAAFLIIIYSQITSYGISNYEIKKMIPRLIIAAILVNVSYFICAAAVDLSNILGDSIAKALADIRNSLPAPMPQGDFFNKGGTGAIWGAVTTFVLSGGTIGAIGLTGATAGGSVAALATLLFPVLVMAILSVLVALLVLAARQALITVLVVLSPLAFVAFLLPNTEKQFDRWRGLFTTMLMVFPMFSLLFGGSQLASYIIIQNTDQISVVILALFVQAAPLALTPFLVRFSGSLLGKLAGMVNNPQKGLVDRSRNWAKDRADTMAKRKMALGENRRGFTPSGLAYRRSRNKQKRERTKKLYESQLEGAYANDRAIQGIMADTKAAEFRKATGDAVTERKFEHMKHTTPAMQNLAGIKRVEEMRTKQMHSDEEVAWNEMLSRNMSATNQFKSFAPAARIVQEEQRIADGRLAAAQAQQKIEFANDMIASESLQRRMGGVADHGSQRALASAVSEYRKDYNDKVAEAQAILKHFNLSSEDRQKHALGEEVWVRDESGRMMALRADSLFTREAAIDTQMRIGRYKEQEAIMQMSGSELQKFRTTISTAMAEGGSSKKAVFLGGSTIDRAAQGKITSFDDLMTIVLESVAKGKVSANDLATNEDHALKRMYEVITTQGRYKYEGNLTPEDRGKLDESIKQMIINAKSVLSNPQIGNSLKGNARDELLKIASLGSQYGVSDSDVPPAGPPPMPSHTGPSEPGPTSPDSPDVGPEEPSGNQ